MQVSKWETAAVIRLPAAVVDALELKEGDHIEATIAGSREFEIHRDRSRKRRSSASENFGVRFPPVSPLAGSLRMKSGDLLSHDDPHLFDFVETHAAIAEKLLMEGGIHQCAGVERVCGCGPAQTEHVLGGDR